MRPVRQKEMERTLARDEGDRTLLRVKPGTLTSFTNGVRLEPRWPGLDPCFAIEADVFR
jgi:hypothetical protein